MGSPVKGENLCWTILLKLKLINKKINQDLTRPTSKLASAAFAQIWTSNHGFVQLKKNDSKNNFERDTSCFTVGLIDKLSDQMWNLCNIIQDSNTVYVGEREVAVKPQEAVLWVLPH